MHEWMSLLNWTSMGVAMTALVALVAFVGYAAVYVAWRGTRS